MVIYWESSESLSLKKSMWAKAFKWVKGHIIVHHILRNFSNEESRWRNSHIILVCCGGACFCSCFSLNYPTVSHCGVCVLLPQGQQKQWTCRSRHLAFVFGGKSPGWQPLLMLGHDILLWQFRRCIFKESESSEGDQERANKNLPKKLRCILERYSYFSQILPSIWKLRSYLTYSEIVLFFTANSWP